MRTTTACNHQKRFIGLIEAIYSETECLGRNHLEHIEELKKRVWDNEALKRCPNHVKSYLFGYSAAMWNNFTRYKTVWVLPHNGVNYKKWNELPEEGKEAYRNGAIGKHVHKNNETKEW